MIYTIICLITSAFSQDFTLPELSGPKGFLSSIESGLSLGFIRTLPSHSPNKDSQDFGVDLFDPAYNTEKQNSPILFFIPPRVRAAFNPGHLTSNQPVVAHFKRFRPSPRMRLPSKLHLTRLSQVSFDRSVKEASLPLEGESFTTYEATTLLGRLFKIERHSVSPSFVRPPYVHRRGPNRSEGHHTSVSGCVLSFHSLTPQTECFVDDAGNHVMRASVRTDRLKAPETLCQYAEQILPFGKEIEVQFIEIPPIGYEPEAMPYNRLITKLKILE